VPDALPDATIAEIRQALLTHLVIFFRAQRPDGPGHDVAQRSF
jgi:alpha-ketoglutarate-dependent taurine dioxygenase